MNLSKDNTKICKHCGSAKPTAEFCITRSAKDGLSGVCRECSWMTRTKSYHHVSETTIPNEEWRCIAGWTSLYSVSNLGRVRRERQSSLGLFVRILNAQSNGRYIHVTLADGSRKDTPNIHRLVAGAFLGIAPFADAQVNHKNGIKTDNRSDNLEWITQKENSHHARTVLNTYRIGADHGRAKLGVNDVLTIRKRLKNGDGLTAIANDYNVTSGLIGHIRAGRAWKHVP